MRYSYWSRVRLAWLREDVKALMEKRDCPNCGVI